MADVFISYSRKDEAFAQQLTAALAEQKRDVWLDRQDIEFSADWKRRVLRGVEEARVFVCILSPDYATSAVCREEANHAIAHNKRLVTILRRPVDFTMLLPAITAINALPFAETDDFVAGVQKLTTALDTDFDWLDQHTRLLQRALDWDRKARDKSLILRGSELRAAEEWLAAAGNARERNPTQLQTEYILISRRASNRRLRTLLGIAIAVIALTIVLAALALIQRGVARTERARAEQRTREVSQNLSRRDFLEATRRLRTNEGGAALAYLARALRVDPQNRVAQQRLVSLLSQRNWQFPLLNPLVHTDGVWSAEFSPDGKRIVTSGGANPVQLWNIVNGERIAELVTTPTISKVLFSRDGTRIAVVYDREFGDPSAQSVRCQLFEGITGKALMELPPHDGSLAVASFAGDSKRLLLGLRLNNGGGEVCVYDLATSAPAQTLLFSINAVPEAFEASGARAIMLEHNGDEKAKVARVWDLRTGKPTTRPFPHQEEVESAIFSPDGDHIATRTRSRAFVWELASDRLLYSTEPGPESQFLSQITYSPDAKLLVTIDVGHPTRQTDWTAQIYDALTGAVLGPGVRDHGLFGDVAFSPDSKLLLLCSSGQRARVWFVPSPDTVEPQEATAPLEHSDAVTVAKMSPDGQRIVTGSFDRTLRVLDASAGIGELSPEKLSSANPFFLLT